MADTLATLMRLRAVACEQAMRQLAAALAREEAAGRALAEARAAPAEQAAAIGATGEPDMLSRAYAAWLPQALRAVASHAAAAQEATTASADAAATLTAHLAARKAAETLLDQRRTAARKRWQARMQRLLDECAAPRR